jgi:hypothetical protein
MTVDKLALQITTDTSQTEKSIGSIRTELRQATQDAVALARKFGDFSPEALGAAQRVANLKDEIGDLKARIDSLNPDRKFQAFSQSLQGVAGGFAGLQGAIGLFGTESKDLEKQLLKVQSALALSEGLNAILESKDAFKNMGNVAVQAFKAIKGAIGATGIGLLVIALGTIYAYWDDIKGAVSGVSEEQKKLNKDSAKGLETEKDKLNTVSSQDNILKLQGKSERDILKIKMKQTDEVIRASEIQIQNQIITNAAAVQAAKRNKEILTGILRFIAAPLSLLLKTVDMVGTALGKDFGLEEKLFGGIANLVFDPGQVADEGAEALKQQRIALAKLKNDRAGFQLQIQELDKPKETGAGSAKGGTAGADKKTTTPEEDQAAKDAKDKKEAFEKGQQELNDLNAKTAEENRLAKLSQFERDNEILTADYLEKLAKAKEFNTSIEAIDEEYIRKSKELQDAQDAKDFEAQLAKDAEAIAKKEGDFANDLAILDRQREAIVNNTKLTEEARTKLLDENSKARQAIETAETEHKKKQVGDTLKLLGDLGTVLGQQTAAGKALGIATALINTYQGATEALKEKSTLPQPFSTIARFASAAAIIANGIKTVKQITSVKVPGGGGGGGGASGANPISGGAGAAVMQAPIAQSVQIQQTALTPGGNGVNLQNQATVKAFVVESDITDSQDRIAKIKAAATI